MWKQNQILRGVNCSLVEFNEFIYLMCCLFLQVHVIHKLTKDISMLRRKKTKSEVDKSKNERKVSRFVQEVQVSTKP